MQQEQKGQARRAYDDIRELILTGAIGPGQRLGEVALAEQIGVSRTPIREALRMLHAEGLARVTPNRGTRVSDLTPLEVRSSYEVRSLLESSAARLAAPRISDDQLGRLRDCQDRMDRAVQVGSTQEIDQIVSLNREFHKIVFEAADNVELSALMASVIVPPLHRRFWTDSAARKRSCYHHREIIAALEARDDQWAEAIMKAHLLAARAFLSSIATKKLATGDNSGIANSGSQS